MWSSMDSSSVGLTMLVSSTLLWRYWTQKPKAIEVSEIWIYPIKSCKGFKTNSAKIVKTGFKHDREFMLVNEEGRFVTQRQFPLMALIEVTLQEADGEYLLIKWTISQ